MTSQPAAHVRVRYAPSPTGTPHVGNIRTALFNWLFARHHGGSFIIRIEDTDQARIVEGATQATLDSLTWLGLDWDEGPAPDGEGERGGYGPYFQSARTRLGIYRQHAERLVASGHAYGCFCTPQLLERMREQQQAQGRPPMYDRRCRHLSAAERQAQEARGTPSVVRLKVPESGETAFHDLIRGDISFQNAVLDDLVLLKSDGFPTYHLANVVDDHLMEITHVLRAEEWVSSTPRHTLLYQAFGWQPPLFAHLPIILGPDRSKLSKRHGAISLLEYRDQGYLPEAMLNFLALIGWSLDDKTEIMSREDLVRHFTIERVHKAAGIFNREKLDWMNGHYIRQLSPATLAERMKPFLERSEGGLPAEVPRPIDHRYLVGIAKLVQERLTRLDQSVEHTLLFFEEDVRAKPEEMARAFDKKSPDAEGALRALQAALARIETLPTFDAAALEGALRPLAEELGLKTGQLFGAVRVAVTGRTVAPPLFETMAALGRERCVARMRKGIAALRPAA